MIPIRAYLFLILALCMPPLLRAQTFTRTGDVPPVRLNYRQLASIIGRAERFVSTANESYTGRSWDRSEALDVRAGSTKTELTKDVAQSAGDLGPLAASSVYYRYAWSGAPISGVTLDLGDFRRSVTVSGSSRTEVDALSRLLAGDLKVHTTMFGGFGFRTAGAIAMLLLFAVLFAVAGVPNLPRVNRTVAGLLCVATIALLLLAPWQAWFPGTAVYAGSSSWLVRNQALVTALGTLLALTTAVSQILRPLFPRRAGASRGTDAGAPG